MTATLSPPSPMQFRAELQERVRGLLKDTQRVRNRTRFMQRVDGP